MILPKIGERLKKAYDRPPIKTHEEFAESEVIFKGQDVSPILGTMSLKYSAHMRLPFQIMDQRKTRRVYAKWASQSAKSLLLSIAAGKRLVESTGYIHYLLPVSDKIPRMIKVKIDPTFKAIPKVWKMFQDYKDDERVKGQQTIKQTSGGGMVITGVSATDLKTLTVPMTVADECAEMPTGTMLEAEERQKSFSRFFPLTLAASTIVHPGDEICNGYDNCEWQGEYHFICPSCKESFNPSSKTFGYEKPEQYVKRLGIDEEDIRKQDFLKNAKKTVYIKCPHCSYKINKDERDTLTLDGVGMEWVTVEGELDTAISFGFAMNSLASYMADMDEIVEKYIAAQGDEIKLDKLYRNWFNEFYEGVLEKRTDADDLLALGNGLDEWVIPDNTVVVYHTIDTQKDYFWSLVIAFEYGVEEGGVSRVGKRHIVSARRIEDFGGLVDIMERKFYHEDGCIYRGGIKRQLLDAQGYYKKNVAFNDDTQQEEDYFEVNRPQEVKEYVDEFAEYFGRNGEYERVYATIGAEFLTNEKSYTFITTEMETEQYIGNSLKKETKKLKALKLGTVALKLSALNGLNRAVMKSKAVEGDDAFNFEADLTYINQTQIDEIKTLNRKDPTSIVEQLTSEIYGYRRDGKGNIMNDRKTFIRVKKENHLLDCLAMAEAPAQMDDVRFIKKPLPKDEVKKSTVMESIKTLLD